MDEGVGATGRRIKLGEVVQVNVCERGACILWTKHAVLIMLSSWDSPAITNSLQSMHGEMHVYFNLLRQFLVYQNSTYNFMTINCVFLLLSKLCNLF